MSLNCRICSQDILHECFDMNGSFIASPELQIKEVLQILIPDFDVDLIPESVACKNCVSTLYISYRFIQEATRNEKLIANHIRKNDMEKATGDSTVIVDEMSFKYLVVNNDDDEEEEDDVEPNLVKTEPNDDADFIYADLEDEIDAIEIMRTAKPSNIEIVEEKSSQVKKAGVNGDSEDDFEFSETTEVVPKQERIDVTTYFEYKSNRKPPRNIKRPFKCDSCNFRSDSRASLLMHMRIHTGEKPYHCTKCLYRAKRKAHLEEHMKLHTGERPFICQDCGRSFRTKLQLNHHLLIHRGEKPYKCVKCEFSTRHKTCMENHIKRIHMGIPLDIDTKQSICYICGKTLTGQAGLRVHMKIHSGIKAHQCDYCGKYFRERTMLKNHLRTHTGEKPFKCNLCDYSGTRKAHLQQHLARHSENDILFQCDLCENKYNSKILVKKHMKEDHNSFN